MLLGEDRRRHQDHHLLAVLHGLERRAQRHLGLAVADVAADQAVHRPRGLHVGLDELDRVALVGRLGVGERVLELPLPVAVDREGVALAALALGVEVEQLAGQLLGGAAGAGLDRVPAGATQLGQRRVAATAPDVAADLGQLVDGHEHPVRAGVLQVQVVPGDVGDRLGVKAGEAGDPVVLVDDDVSRAQLGEAPQHAAAPHAPRALGRAPAVEQPVLGDHREVELRRDEARLQPCGGERDLPAGGRRVVVGSEPADLQPAEVVGDPLALAAAGEGDHRPVARARELLELWLGLLQAAGGDVRRLGAEGERLILVDAREADPGSLLERRIDPAGGDVEMVRVLVVERGRDVLPVVGQRGRDVLLTGDQHHRVLGHELQQRMEVLDRQQLGDVGPVGLLLERGDLGQLPVLGRELGGGCDLDHLGIAERALGEGREPAQRLDLVAEQVDAHGTVLGGREQVKQSAADRELAAVLHLVHALVSGGHQVQGGLVEVDQVTGAQLEAVRAHRPIRHLLAQRDRAHHDHRRGLRDGLEQRVQRGDPQSHEVRRRRQMRLVGDAAAGVVADAAGRQPGLQAGRQIPRRPVVAGDHDRRSGGVAVQQRRDQIRPQRLGYERLAAVARQRSGLRIVVGMGEEGAEHQGPTFQSRHRAGAADQPPGSPSRITRSAASAASSTSAATSARGSEKRPST